MNEVRRDRLLKQARAKHDRVVSEARATLERELLSIETVFALERESMPDGDSAGKRRNADIAKAVVAVLPMMDGRFTATGVVDRLKREGQTVSSPKSIANILERLARDEVLRIAERGAGRRATAYEYGTTLDVDIVFGNGRSDESEIAI